MAGGLSAGNLNENQCSDSIDSTTGPSLSDAAAQNTVLLLVIQIVHTTSHDDVVGTQRNFHPPITIINSKNIITLINNPTGICLEFSFEINH